MENGRNFNLGILEDLREEVITVLRGMGISTYTDCRLSGASQLGATFLVTFPVNKCKARVMKEKFLILQRRLMDVFQKNFNCTYDKNVIKIHFRDEYKKRELALSKPSMQS